jgi:GntR family transcriptional regulator/MocR family aminotransferase
MILPSGLVESFSEKMGFYSCTVPIFEQYVLAEFINNGDFERHINRTRRKLRQQLKKI